MVVAAYAVPLLYVGVLAPRLGWRNLMAAVGFLELLGAVIIARGVADISAPGISRGAGFSRYVTDVLRNRPARRVILAYAAHNWELFGMWGWITPFMVASLSAREDAH